MGQAEQLGRAGVRAVLLADAPLVAAPDDDAAAAEPEEPAAGGLPSASASAAASGFPPGGGGGGGHVCRERRVGGVDVSPGSAPAATGGDGVEVSEGVAHLAVAAVGLAAFVVHVAGDALNPLPTPPPSIAVAKTIGEASLT